MCNLTPMMQQYMEFKEKYRDSILFFRLGDFYEMFYDDAELASRELELTLTGRPCGKDVRAPMCGVPIHASAGYIAKLISKGYKVAICEQMEDVAEAKGLVRREVIRVITPGTVIETEMLDDKKNNYLMAIKKDKRSFGLAYVDVSTGEFLATMIDGENVESRLVDEVDKVNPSEIIIFLEEKDEEVYKRLSKMLNSFISYIDEEKVDLNVIRDITIDDKVKENHVSEVAVAALVSYLSGTQKITLPHIDVAKWYTRDHYLVLDCAARKNLELTETIRDGGKRGSLIWTLDRTQTSMGARKLRKWIERPLVDIMRISKRLDAVGNLKDNFIIRNEIMESLQKVYDIERLATKLAIGNVNCRDLISLKMSLKNLPFIKEQLEKLDCNLLRDINSGIDTLTDVVDIIESAIVEDPPITIKEGGIIKSGYDRRVDELRKATKEGKQWIAEFEAREKERTGIKNLKVGFNKVFGYYIEVTRSYYNMVPDTYIRKQTLANCERYITNDLKRIENMILGAQDKVIVLEYDLFVKVKENIASSVMRMKKVADNVATLDVLCALAEVADRMNYVKPNISDDGVLKIKEGRHPVVEKVMDDNSFVPNDTYLDTEDSRLAIITGPNMAGKSTYMRQVALIVLMAQMGSFVSASEANIGIADKIFTRVGASDNLALGQSTFMVEMHEVADIVKNATRHSLIILDEIGRGTSTYDGLSIAWAVVEHIADKSKIGARTLFATHYHELTELEDKINGVKNYCISVEKNGDDIVFLRKIVRGGADESYGVYVAKLSGVPDCIINRAQDILKNLEKEEMKRIQKKLKIPVIDGQIDMFSMNNSSETKLDREIVGEIKTMDVTTLTPLDALNLLYKLQQKVNEG